MHPGLLPAFFGIAAAGGAYYLGAYPTPQAGADSIALGGALASIAGTMLGFMLAALAVLASINHTHLVKMMRQTGHYRDLLLTLFIGAAVLAACLVVGYAVLFAQALPRNVSIAIVALHAAALSSIMDVGRKFWRVLTNLRSEDE